MPTLYQQYQQHFQAGQQALSAQQHDIARRELLNASRVLLELAAQDTDSQQRELHKQRGLRLLELARRLPTTADRAAAPAERRAEPAGATNEAPRKWEVSAKPGIWFDDIAGLAEVKDLIRRRILLPFKNPELASQYGRKPGGGILMYGPPGTGKTMMAKAIATELDATFFNVRCSDIMSKWVGEAEQNFKELFDAARAQPLAVIFLDETEALVGKRGGQSTIMNRVIPEFLAQVDGLQGRAGGLLLLGATNRPWDIDPAALRPGRFGEHIYVGLPDQPARKFILAATLGRLPCDESVDWDRLAAGTEGLSGADLQGLVDRIVDPVFEQAMATGQTVPVGGADVERGLAETKPSVTARDLERYRRFREGGG